MFYKIIVLALLASSMNSSVIAVQSENSESTESNTSDVSSIPDGVELSPITDDSDKSSDSMKSSRSRSVSPRLEMYGVYVVDDSCKSLTNADISDENEFSVIEIPPSVESISEYAFVGYTKLNTAIMPVKHFRSIIGAFAQIKGQLKRIHVVGCNDKQHANRIITILENEYGFDKKSIKVDVKGEYTIDTSLPGLGCQIPISCANYVAIEIKGVTPNIVDAASFLAIPNIEHITLPESVNRIHAGAFDACKDLKSITLPRAAYENDKSSIEAKGFRKILSKSRKYVTLGKM